jgi:hypothetical protein
MGKCLKNTNITYSKIVSMENLEKYLDSIGEKSSTQRLGVIATMNLGERSEAARRVCEKRYRRKELMDMGLSFENAVLIVNKENTVLE